MIMMKMFRFGTNYICIFSREDEAKTFSNKFINQIVSDLIKKKFKDNNVLCNKKILNIIFGSNLPRSVQHWSV